MDVGKLGALAAEELLTLGEKLKYVSHSKVWKFSRPFEALNDDRLSELKCDIDSKLKLEMKKCLSIYQFRISEETSTEMLNNTISEARRNNLQSRAFPRANSPSGGDPQCLYVGSSRNTARRLAEHLGLGNAKTYSLQLSHWAGNLPGIFEIQVYQYEATDENYELIPIMEDHLAGKLKPMLGRKGRL